MIPDMHSPQPPVQEFKSTDFRPVDVELLTKIAVVAEKLDVLTKQMEERKGYAISLEKRVSALERNAIRTAAIASVVACIASAVLPIIVPVLKKLV